MLAPLATPDYFGAIPNWANTQLATVVGGVVSTAAYSTNVRLNVPQGSTYSIWVGYRPTVGFGAFTTFGHSSGSFTVN